MTRTSWWRAGALGGLGFVILQLTAQALIQLGGGEPAFSAGAGEIVSFFRSKDPVLFQAADYLNALSAIGFVWFLGCLWDALAPGGGRVTIAQVVAVSSGLMALTAVVSASGWPLAVFRGDDLEQQLARYLFDQGNYGFANLWLFLASMLLAVGLAGPLENSLPAWLRWSALGIGVALLLARAFWASTGIVFLPYMVFWLWLIAICILWLRTPVSSGATATEAGAR